MNILIIYIFANFYFKVHIFIGMEELLKDINALHVTYIAKDFLGLSFALGLVYLTYNPKQGETFICLMEASEINDHQHDECWPSL